VKIREAYVVCNELSYLELRRRAYGVLRFARKPRMFVFIETTAKTRLRRIKDSPTALNPSLLYKQHNSAKMSGFIVPKKVEEFDDYLFMDMSQIKSILACMKWGWMI